MSLNNNKELYIKMRRISLYVFLSFLLIFNLFVFFNLVSSNSSFLTDYQSPVDELKDFRKPLMVLEFKNIENKNKLIILPDNIISHPYVKNHKAFFKGYDRIMIITSSKTTEKHFDYIKNFSDNVFFGDELNDDVLKNNALLVYFEDMENPSTDYEKIKEFIKRHNLRPKTSDLLDTSHIKTVLDEKYKKKKYSLDEQYQNLESFAKDFNQELNKFKLNNNKEYPPHFYDKASTLVYACDDMLKCKEFTDFSFNKSLIKSLSKNINNAQKEGYKIKNIYLLTKLEKQNFKTEDELLNSLDTSIGVLIKNGILSGIMLPVFWKKYEDKNDFINQLKIKSGLNPDYFKDTMEIYYFKAVEIHHENKWL